MNTHRLACRRHKHQCLYKEMCGAWARGHDQNTPAVEAVGPAQYLTVQSPLSDFETPRDSA